MIHFPGPARESRKTITPSHHARSAQRDTLTISGYTMRLREEILFAAGLLIAVPRAGQQRGLYQTDFPPAEFQERRATTEAATTIPLSTTLGGVTVRVSGRLACHPTIAGVGPRLLKPTFSTVSVRTYPAPDPPLASRLYSQATTAPPTAPSTSPYSVPTMTSPKLDVAW